MKMKLESFNGNWIDWDSVIVTCQSIEKDHQSQAYALYNQKLGSVKQDPYL